MAYTYKPIYLFHVYQEAFLYTLRTPKRLSPKVCPMMASDRAAPAKDLLETLFRRLRRLAQAAARPVIGQVSPALGPQALIGMCQQLLDERSQSSGVHLAGDILGAYARLDDADRRVFLCDLAQGFAPDAQAIRSAMAAYDADPTPLRMAAISRLAEAPRQEVLRRLNQAPMATGALVNMRADVLRFVKDDPALRVLDQDMAHLCGHGSTGVSGHAADRLVQPGRFAGTDHPI
jgi:malonyl-CoA decarboxylase